MEIGFCELPVTRIVQKTQILDVRHIQARILWNNGWGRSRFPSFDAYLATIPCVPHPPQDPRFRVPVLVDTSMKLVDACRVLGVQFGGNESVFTIPPSRSPDAEIYWIWVIESPANAGAAPHTVVQIHNTFERALIAYEGIAYFAQHQDMLYGDSVICLAGSRLCSFPAYCACLLISDGGPTLGVTEYCLAKPEQETPLRWW